MSRQPESKLVDAAVRLFRGIPDFWFTKVNQRSIRGTPDILGCKNGVFVAIEFKIPPNKPTKIQEHTLSQIEEAGGEALICVPKNLKAIVEIIRQTKR